MPSEEMLKKLLEEFAEKEALANEELKYVNEQIMQLEAKLEDCRRRLSTIGGDREKVLSMRTRYLEGVFENLPRAAVAQVPQVPVSTPVAPAPVAPPVAQAPVAPPVAEAPVAPPVAQPVAPPIAPGPLAPPVPAQPIPGFIAPQPTYEEPAAVAEPYVEPEIPPPQSPELPDDELMAPWRSGVTPATSFPRYVPKKPTSTQDVPLQPVAENAPADTAGEPGAPPKAQLKAPAKKNKSGISSILGPLRTAAAQLTNSQPTPPPPAVWAQEQDQEQEDSDAQQQHAIQQPPVDPAAILNAAMQQSTNRSRPMISETGSYVPPSVAISTALGANSHTQELPRPDEPTQETSNQAQQNASTEQQSQEDNNKDRTLESINEALRSMFR